MVIIKTLRGILNHSSTMVVGESISGLKEIPTESLLLLQLLVIGVKEKLEQYNPDRMLNSPTSLLTEVKTLLMSLLKLEKI